jgi:hypothetical protein
MMHPGISRELSRAQQQETLRREANPAARVVRETAGDRRPHEHRPWTVVLNFVHADRIRPARPE